MADNQKHQGWTNYNTWNFKLWIDNDPGTQRYWTERAKELLKSAKASKYATKKENATGDLADELKDSAEDNNPLEGVFNTYADMLRSAIGDIAFYEIAQSLMEKSSEYKNGGIIDFLFERISLKDIITK